MKATNGKRSKSSTATPDAARAWKQFEDHLIPRLRLSVIDRAVYSHLLRHSRLEGKRRLRFSIFELARRLRISDQPVRDAIRRLIDYDLLRLLERTNAGHVVEVRLPQEIRAICATGLEPSGSGPIRPRFYLERAVLIAWRVIGKIAAFRLVVHKDLLHGQVVLQRDLVFSRSQKVRMLFRRQVLLHRHIARAND